MKIVIPFLTTAFASDLISYKLSDASFEIASLVLTDSNFLSQVFTHGCWCAKLANPTDSNLGGATSVDDLDQICKEWAGARRCSRSSGSNCEFADFTTSYELNLSPIQQCVDSDPCLSETCQIDYHFISLIEDWSQNQNSITLNTDPTCAANSINIPNNGNSGNSVSAGNCASFVTTPMPTPLPACEVGQDYIGCNGNDLIRYFDSNAAECQVQCLADSNCDLWVYVDAWQRCHLKNAGGNYCTQTPGDTSIIPGLVVGFDYECEIPNGF